MLIPLWIKLSFTIMTLIVVAVYVFKYPLSNFLWFSDIALITTAVALWLENGYLASMMAVGVLLPEMLWNVSFFVQLTTGTHVSGLTDYMFEKERPVYLRALSLFHVPLPPLLLWMIATLGYSSSAWIAQSVLALIVLPLSYWLSKPKDNVNWVYGFGAKPQKRFPPLVHLGFLMIGLPLLIFLPTHLLLQMIFGS